MRKCSLHLWSAGAQAQSWDSGMVKQDWPTPGNMPSDLRLTLWFSQGKRDVAGQAKPENRDHHTGDSSNRDSIFADF